MYSSPRNFKSFKAGSISSAAFKSVVSILNLMQPTAANCRPLIFVHIPIMCARHPKILFKIISNYRVKFIKPSYVIAPLSSRSFIALFKTAM